MEFYAGNRMQNYGLALFCKYPMVNRGRIDLESGTSTCCYADILFREDTLRVYNLHLQSTRLSDQQYGFLDTLKLRYDDQQMEEFRDLSVRLRDAFVKRAAQADIVKTHTDSCPYPLILCGDFNDTPVSYTCRTIRKGLQDVFAEAGWGVGRTYVGRFPSFRIDYIFCSDAFEALHFNNKKLRLSDHYPVTGFLRLP
jgi:endonuclease/exonuclease/phosphatase family metal-dependent hydrolase